MIFWQDCIFRSVRSLKCVRSCTFKSSLKAMGEFRMISIWYQTPTPYHIVLHDDVFLSLSQLQQMLMTRFNLSSSNIPIALQIHLPPVPILIPLSVLSSFPDTVGTLCTGRHVRLLTMETCKTSPLLKIPSSPQSTKSAYEGMERPLTAPSSDQSLFRRPINHQKTIRPTTASTGPLRGRRPYSSSGSSSVC